MWRVENALTLIFYQFNGGARYVWWWKRRIASIYKFIHWLLLYSTSTTIYSPFFGHLMDIKAAPPLPSYWTCDDYCVCWCCVFNGLNRTRTSTSTFLLDEEWNRDLKKKNKHLTTDSFWYLFTSTSWDSLSISSSLFFFFAILLTQLDT